MDELENRKVRLHQFTTANGSFTVSLAGVSFQKLRGSKSRPADTEWPFRIDLLVERRYTPKGLTKWERSLLVYVRENGKLFKWEQLGAEGHLHGIGEELKTVDKWFSERVKPFVIWLSEYPFVKEGGGG